MLTSFLFSGAWYGINWVVVVDGMRSNLFALCVCVCVCTLSSSLYLLPYCASCLWFYLILFTPCSFSLSDGLDNAKWG